MFRRCTSRRPTDAEQRRLQDYLAEQRHTFGEDSQAASAVSGNDREKAPPAELAAWTALARVLLNLDEFITRE